MLLPVLFLGVTIFMSIELYQYAQEGMQNAATLNASVNPVLPLLIFNIVLIALIVSVYVFHQLRSRYLTLLDFFDEEKTGYVRRTADALRTPLTGLRWITEMIMAGDMGKINKEQKDSMEKMHRATERLIGQTNELLKVTKISGAVIHYRPEKSDVKATIKNAILNVTPLVEAKNQTMTLAKNASGFVCNIDKNLIEHLVEVLLTNASYLTSRKGKIFITLQSTPGNSVINIEATPIKTGRAHAARKIQTIPGIEKAPIGEYSEDVSMGVSYEILQAANGQLWIEHKGDIVRYSIVLPTNARAY